MELNLNLLLAKATEYGLPLQRNEQSDATLLNKAITDHEREQNELSIRTATAMYAEEEIEELIRIGRIRESISGIVNRRRDNQLNEWQMELLEKAKHYRIACNPENQDWLKLENTIEEIESLFKEAESYNIYDYDVNDLVDLRQKIEAAQHQAAKEGRSTRNEYLASIL